MTKRNNPPGFKGHRFPSEIIEHGVWLYYRFSLSLRDVEDILAERGIIVNMTVPSDAANHSDICWSGNRVTAGFFNRPIDQKPSSQC